MRWTVGAVTVLSVSSSLAAPLSASGGPAASADASERAIANGLEYLARAQRENGTYPGNYGESAAIPSLAGMAFLSMGHLPGSDKYGEKIERALDYVLTCADLRDDAPFRGYMGVRGNGRMYAHSIATLFLSEVSGMVDGKRQSKIDRILPLATRVILDAQNQRKDARHLGGWRYTPNASDSDLSCSGWALMALRSVRLNGAQIQPEAIEKAVLYIKRMHRDKDGTFGYQGNGQNAATLSGAAVLCLELCGKHLDPMSLKAAKYLEKSYRQSLPGAPERYYGLYYTAQGLFQIGGPVWRDFSAWMYDRFVPEQRADGSWGGRGNNGSDAYATAMTVLAFAVPYRMLPIYQRDETVDPDLDNASWSLPLSDFPVCFSGAQVEVGRRREGGLWPRVEVPQDISVTKKAGDGK